ncbi:Matrix-remodeling-associated protein 7 [Nibea albiflora]|uniref:Matrix-remodeling-associated protein 7 n=1 Tax=Nibea albiflora TaxID=240163 RepID=A0ACB7F3V6_NIBAL|nr:Matrix-remodeling-associated protein 7 [Nibea albiflora]
MDLTFILSAAIFTLLAIVVATSLLNGSTYAREPAGPGLDQSGPKQNGYVPDKKKKKKAVDDWCEMSGSSHDHWDVVKSVLSVSPVRTPREEEAHPHPHTEELATPVEQSSSTSMSLGVDSSPEASSGKGRRSFIGLSDKELLKCAFSHPQTEGAAESPAVNDKVGLNENNSLKYVPGKARSHHLEMMMSTEELEEEQRVQREQLAAIFQLLKDNQETFGELSEGDMEEQLRLYSI